MIGGSRISRRGVLAGAGSLLGLGSLRSAPVGDGDGDGIADRRERSGSLERQLVDTFGADAVAELDADRPDLLIDARYVGTAGVSDAAKRSIERRFREHGIHLQWLDYPERYDRQRFEERYGDRVERILWPFGSFYADAVEEYLRNVALQVIVLPTRSENLQSLYTVHQGEAYQGVSFGNRCLVTEQDAEEDEMVLFIHEIGHLVLCHNDDPESVMSATPKRAQFTPAEWEQLRVDLENVHDVTGFDIAFRSCLLGEYRDELLEGLA